ncbi:MAG: type I glutamate--ammonia ligase [Actinomycetaceae bacterium]|nr:type I glutamate--ammonia ligase [Actinomycetaceae bacterium]
MNRQQEYVLRTIEERGVRFVRLWFTDIAGKLKSVAIAPAELEEAFEEGIGFDGSSIEGLTRVLESDMLACPDAATFQILPWRGDAHPVARMFCDITTRDNEPARSDPRSILKRALAKAGDMGFTCYVHPEVEFYLFHPENDPRNEPVPIDTASYFDHVSRSTAYDFRREAIITLEEMGISVEFSHHENGPGQNEIDLRYSDALSMADNIMTFRAVIEEVAIRQGVQASFMPKPLMEHPGSGMHTHISLFEGENNVFYEPSGQYGLSQTGRQFMAGLLRHAPEITAITNQHVNSYKRLWGGGEAPSYVCWGPSNHSALIRLPAYKPDKPQSARIEYRAPDSAANPYLLFAMMLQAGLAGIEGEYELPEPADSDVFMMSLMERRLAGIKNLPHTLNDALKVMEESELVARVLGEDCFDYYLRDKYHEWAEYDRQITPAERQRFLSTY